MHVRNDDAAAMATGIGKRVLIGEEKLPKSDLISRCLKSTRPHFPARYVQGCCNFRQCSFDNILAGARKFTT